jgi:hypothetical protein
LGHHEFRLVVPLDNDVHMITSDVGGENLPTPIAAALQDCFEYRLTARIVQLIMGLIHQLHFSRATPWIRRDERCSVMIVAAIYRALGISMNM